MNTRALLAPPPGKTAGRARWPLRVGRALALGLLALAAPLAEAETNALKDIEFAALPGDRVRITLVLESEAPEPLSFTIDNPARIALDFPATRNALEKKSRTIGVGVAQSISTAEANNRTRVVVNLVQLAPYETRVEGNKVHVLLEHPTGAEGRARAAAAEAGPGPAARGGDRNGHRVVGVDFRRTEEGAGQVIVELSDPTAPVDVRQEGERLLVDFKNTSLPQKLERRLDVVDFATPVNTVETFAHGSDTRMVVHPTGEYEHLAYQSERVFTLEVKPLTKEEKEAREKEEFEYTGERLSLNFQDIEVRSVLQLLADFTGLNIVVSDSVQGSLTLRLKNVPWDQALDIILKTKGLDMRKTGNVILVAPTEEIAAREKLELEAQKQIQDLAPLRSEFIQVNYAKAGDLASLIKAKENSLLSERGNVSIDERTNTLLVQDTAEKLADIRRLVNRLDIPVRQVLIESRIVVANDDFSEELGVRFGYSQTATHASHGATVGGKLPGDTDFGGTTAFSSGGNENLIVDLPVNNPAGALGLAIGKVGTGLLQLELSALQAEGRGEVISSPRVITANQKEALIEQGVEIPYQQATSSGATSVQFKKAVLSLQVTPQITPDDRVILDLRVNKDSVGDIFAGVPSIDTREVATQVLVDNGETVVLGGIYERERNNEVDRVPFFGELPYLGFLFRQKLETDNKAELLVFVTPKIVKEKLAVTP